MIFKNACVLGVTVLFCVTVSSFAAPDREPNELTDSFWYEHGEIYELPMLDNSGRVYVRQTKFYVADSQLLKSHASDHNGKCWPHVHFRNDYHPSVDLADANRYWDMKADCPRISRRLADATVTANRNNLIVADFVGVSCKYWIDDDDVVTQMISSFSGSATPAMKNVSRNLRFKLGAGGTYEVYSRAYDNTDLNERK